MQVASINKKGADTIKMYQLNMDVDLLISNSFSKRVFGHKRINHSFVSSRNRSASDNVFGVLFVPINIISLKFLFGNS